ncbi:MAG: hypothetical protein IK100_10730 [Muribaculaceae bacterium]|nr:hypothetical protein [Muribaculaceae bacterium]
MAKDNDNKSKLLSALITLLLGGGIVGTLLVTSLNYEYPPKDALLQQLQEPIDFGAEDEEFVEFEEMLADANNEPADPGMQIEEELPTEQNPAQEAGQNEMENQGAVNEPPQPPVATKSESPMKVPEPAPKKETKPQKETAPEAPKPKSKGETKPETPPTNNSKPEAPKKAPNAVENAFNKGNNGGTPGSNTNGTMSKPSIGGGLGGYTEANFPTAPCPGPGTVVMQVVVSSTGKVTKATVVGGTLRSNSRACDICRGLALRSTFRVPKNTMVERTGTLTYTVK